MYKKTRTLSNVENSNIQFTDLFFCIIDREVHSIKAYDLKNTTLQWNTKNKDYTCIILDKIIAGTNLSLYGYNGIQLYHNLYSQKYTLEFSDKENLLLYKTVNEELEEVLYHVFNSSTLTFINSNIKLNYPLFFLDKENIVCQHDKFNDFNFNIIELFNLGNNNIVWTLDVKPLFPNQEEVKMYEVKEYQNSLIVLTSAGTLRLSPKDGSVIWKTSSYACMMEIVNNVGYVCTSGSLYKINLDTGEESGYGREYDKVPDFIYEGKNYWSDPYRVVYHDGLLWCSVYSSGHSFLLAINPDNGNYEWIHHVDTNEQTDAPQFYKDRMFIRDTGNILHIYEKE